MQEEFITVAPNITVRGLLDDHITKEFQRAYPVVLGDSWQGLVTGADVMKVPLLEREMTYLSGIITRAANVQSAKPDEPLAVALERLISGDLNQLVVVDQWFPVGLLGRGYVLRVAEIASLFVGNKS